MMHHVIHLNKNGCKIELQLSSHTDMDISEHYNPIQTKTNKFDGNLLNC